MLLTDLADAARKSGLRVVELPAWKENLSAGAFDPDGVLCHHTGAYDDIGDTSSDMAYALWMAFTGRDDLDPPLCNLALSAECVVYVCAAGNANHAGQAKASGPMPAASDGSAIYIGIEAMNSGTQGWGSKGKTAAGEEITQGEAYARLCAALASHYDWPATHTRAHRETSVTGKWDPGGLDMDTFRNRIATLIPTIGDDDMPFTEKQLTAIVQQAVAKELESITQQLDELNKEHKALVRKLIANVRVIIKERFGATDAELDEILGHVEP